MDGVFLPNPAERKDVGNGALIKPYCTIVFKGGFFRDAELSRILVDRDVDPPGVAYILHQPGVSKHV